MNLANYSTVEKLLSAEGFTFKKSLGQNFLIDPSVCPRMAEAACTSETGVLEIGPGIGTLTCELAKVAKKVIAIELDERLKKILPKTLADFDNIKVIFGDAMKMDIENLILQEFSDCERVCICANLPYYITSPIIMHLLESRLPIDSITVMVQKEAAERLCANVGTREAGAVTVAVEYFAQSEILFGVPSNAFMPPPKVDSAVIHLSVRKEPPVTLCDEKGFFSFVKACFAQRRKTLVNTVSNSAGFSKDTLREALKKQNLSETIRSEQLTLDELAGLFNELSK